MTTRKKAIVVGTGAGGAVMANELQGTYDVTVLEAGHDFKPFQRSIPKLAALRKSHLFFDERLIQLLLPNMVVEKSQDMVMVRGKGIGGTTTLATGNAVRYDAALKKLGIDLDDQFDELYKELPITTDHQKKWTPITKQMYEIFDQLGLNPVVTPKFLKNDKCVGCGHCAIGCPTGAKWDTRELIEEAVKKGAVLITDTRVEKVEIIDGKAKAVHTKSGRYEADLIVLCAGGLGTPPILNQSGISTVDRLFVDPVLCVAAAMPNIKQDKQILMPFISQQDGYILSPYMDYLSFFFNNEWHYPINGIVSMMIKLKDEEKGSIHNKKIDKTMSAVDWANMEKGIEQCHVILEKLGIGREKHFLGTLNAGHPGGMLPLDASQNKTLHHPSLPDNLYVADATILPEAMGNPPILTIMALSKKIASIITEQNEF